jgi:hypothetical protein
VNRASIVELLLVIGRDLSICKMSEPAVQTLGEGFSGRTAAVDIFG